MDATKKESESGETKTAAEDGAGPLTVSLYMGRRYWTTRLGLDAKTAYVGGVCDAVLVLGGILRLKGETEILRRIRQWERDLVTNPGLFLVLLGIAEASEDHPIAAVLSALTSEEGGVN